MALKLKQLALLALVAPVLALLFNSGVVFAAAAAQSDGGGGSSTPTTQAPVNDGDPAFKGGKCSTTANCDLITNYVNPLINFLAALVGIATVISIIIGGIQYGSSAGDPSKITAAKNRIRNALIALLTFLFLYGLLNFLIPGGLL